MSDHSVILCAVGLSLLSPAQPLSFFCRLGHLLQAVITWVCLSLCVLFLPPGFIPAFDHPAASFPLSAPRQWFSNHCCPRRFTNGKSYLFCCTSSWKSEDAGSEASVQCHQAVTLAENIHNQTHLIKLPNSQACPLPALTPSLQSLQSQGSQVLSASPKCVCLFHPS